MRADVIKKGDFSRVHAVPQSSQDVPDDTDVRLVVLSIDYPYEKDPANKAIAAAKSILENRGNAPRLFRNTLLFLAVDHTRLQDLDQAVRWYLAWQSIINDGNKEGEDTLGLSPFQLAQAKSQLSAADKAVAARMPEAYQWLLVPTQKEDPMAAVEWQPYKLTGQDALAVRASKKLKNDELMVTAFAGTRLRMDLDKIPLWRGDHVGVRQLIEDYARYLYLTRLCDSKVLLDAISDGLTLLTWEDESFAYADGFDQATQRYRGLRYGQRVVLNESGLVVRPEAARHQIAAMTAAAGATATTTMGAAGTGQQRPPGGAPTPSVPETAAASKRFHGAVVLDSNRVGRDAGRVADEVISHLTSLVGSKVTVTLEIEAEIPSGAPEKVVRTVTENCRTLKFSEHGFELD